MDEEELRRREESGHMTRNNELCEASNAVAQPSGGSMSPRQFPAEIDLAGHAQGHNTGLMHPHDPNWSSAPLGLSGLLQQNLLMPNYMYQGNPPPGLAGLAQQNPYGQSLLYQPPASMHPFAEASHHAAALQVGNLLQAADSQQLLEWLQQLHGADATGLGGASSLLLEGQHGQVNSVQQATSTMPLQNTLAALQSASRPAVRPKTTVAATDEEDPSSSKRKRRYNHEGFPQKLHRLIREASVEQNSHIVKFTEDGKQFQIVDTVAFEGILPRYFRHGKISSFKRLLHMYGFQRTQGTWNEGIFAHASFRRDRPELCKEMVRIERVNQSR